MICPECDAELPDPKRLVLMGETGKLPKAEFKCPICGHEGVI